MGKIKSNNKAAEYVKLFFITTIAAAIAAAVLLLIAAVMLERLGLGASQMRYIIYAVYLTTALTAGIVAGKCRKEKKFVWGALAGTVWFAAILIASMCMNKNGIDAGELFPAAACMIGGGMLGGMVA